MSGSVLWFACIFFRPLYEPDEGRYAEIPREMLVSGEWIVPHLNGFIYIEKPPFQYWMTSLAYSVFGVHEWTARLWTAVSGWMTVGLIAVYVLRSRGRIAALRAWTFGISSFMWMLVAHQLTLDTSLTFFTTAALVAYCESQRAPHLWWLNYAMWVALGCAVLTKGFVALALPAVAFALYCVSARDWRRRETLHMFRGAVVLAMVIAPWMVAIQLRVPDFFDFFVIREHILRYLTPIAERSEPWWFFIPILVAGALPWSVSLLKPLLTSWRAAAVPGEFAERRLLWLSAIVIFVFFSASHSKLVPYILPMMPLLWALACDIGQDCRADALVVDSLVTLAFAICGAAALVWMMRSTPALASIVLPIRGTLVGVFAIIATGSVAALLLVRRAARSSLVALASAWIVAATWIEFGPASLNAHYSAKNLAHVLIERGARNAPIFSIDTYDQTLTFYLGRTVGLVRYRGELEFGIAHDPQRFISTLDEFLKVWNATPKAFAVMPPRTYDELLRRDASLALVTRDDRYVAIAKSTPF